MAQEPHSPQPHPTPQPTPQPGQQPDQPPRPGHGPDARTEEQDHTPRREERAQRDRQAQATAGRGQQAPQRDEKQEQEDRDRMAAASIGAQVILDFNKPAALGARGGAGGTIEENTMIRDGYLAELGFDPQSPSGPQPSADQIAAKREREEFMAENAMRSVGPPRANRSSSLAADLGGEAEPQGGPANASRAA